MLLKGPGISVQVIDFGLAKTVGHQEPRDRITYDGFIGTPAFASPEQFSGAQIDQRSDYFSLGSTLFYLLTGNQPFKADEIAQLLNRTDSVGTSSRSSAFAPTVFPTSGSSSLPKGIPSPVRKLASALLNLNPNARPQNVPAPVPTTTNCHQPTQ